MFVGTILTIMTFLILTDYIYILSIGDRKYKVLSKLIPAIFIISIFIILGLTYIQTGQLKSIMVDFIQSPLFYYVPIFGWLKLTLVSYVAKDMIMCLLFLLIIKVIFMNRR